MENNEIYVPDNGEAAVTDEPVTYTAEEVDELIKREAEKLTNGRERKLERELRAKLEELPKKYLCLFLINFVLFYLQNTFSFCAIFFVFSC